MKTNERWEDRYRFPLVITHDLKRRLKEAAEREHRTLTGQIVHILETSLETTNEPTQPSQ